MMNITRDELESTILSVSDDEDEEKQSEKRYESKRVTADDLIEDMVKEFEQRFLSRKQTFEEEKEIDHTVRFTATIGMGGVHSGVPFHTHNDGWSEVLWGAKRWFLFPRGVIPEFDPDRSQYEWLQTSYPQYLERDEIIECVIRPGEALYFPSNWYHATLNLSPYTVFISTFT